MHVTFTALALALLAPLGITLSAPALATTVAAPQKTSSRHHDKRFGFKFKAPKGWSSIAMKTDEAWLTAKYVSDKSYFHTDKDTLWTAEHTPELLLIAFIKENMVKKKEADVDETDEDGVTTKVIEINNPYKNYEDFLDRTYSGGGFYVDSKEKKKVGKLEVTIYTVKVEKLSRNGPKRIVTYIYHTDDIDYAMQVEVLEAEYKKLKKTLDRSFKSFEEAARTEGRLPTSGKTDDGFFITIREMSEGTPKEQRSKRVESQKLLQERAVRQLPKDWNSFTKKELLVLNHADDKFAKRVGDHATAMLAWMDKTFPYVGKGSYVRGPIIRICKDQEEESAFGRGVRSGASWWSNGGAEILTHQDDGGFMVGSEMDYVNRRLFSHWFTDRDRDLNSALPDWLRGGLNDYIAGGRAKGKKISFKVDDWDRDEARLAHAQGKSVPPRDLITMTRTQFMATSETTGTSYWNRSSQSAMFVRYLLSPEARKCSQAKALIEDYITALDSIIDDQNKRDNDALKETLGEAETEEEENERAKKRADRWRESEQELMDAIYERVFGDWKQKDWKALEKAYFQFLS